MNGSELLLDTNALIAWMRNDADLLSALPEGSSVSVSLFTLVEIHYGIHNSGRPAANMDALRRALRDFTQVLPDGETAALYGEIFYKLRKKGRPIPINDVWIAALALQHTLPIFTRDSHFREVEGLNTISW